MNGDPNQTPPAGWQFKPDASPDATHAVSTVAESPAPQNDETTQMPPTIASDAPKSEAPTEPLSQAEPAEAPPSTVPSGVGAVRSQPESAVASSERHDEEPLRWSASETPHGKPSGWMAMLIGGTVLLAAAIYLVTKDYVNAGAIVAAGLLFGVYSSRKPQTVQYQLDNGGIVIGQKRYPYALFRSFAVEDGGQHGLVLMPLKRFMPLLSMHYPPELEDDVVGVLSDRLPMEAFRRDAMDTISRKLKF